MCVREVCLGCVRELLFCGCVLELVVCRGPIRVCVLSAVEIWEECASSRDGK